MFDFLIDMGKMIVENEIVQLTDAQKEEVNTYIDAVEVDVEAQLNLDSREYLVNTDWYITRKAEIGTAIPMDILAKRAEARAAITLGPR
jgi:maltodextrin utilization protein YvdJ